MQQSPRNDNMKTSWQQRLPTQITLSRIVMVPVILALMAYPSLYTDILAAVLFIIASITDYYDGYFARKYNAISNWGKFMDPIADKILVTSILLILAASQKIDAYMVIIILARDTFIGGVRSVAAADQMIIDAKPAGKWKTALQMVAIPAVIIGEPVKGIPFDKIGYFALWVSVILSVWSGLQYYWAYEKFKREHKKSPNG